MYNPFQHTQPSNITGSGYNTGTSNRKKAFWESGGGVGAPNTIGHADPAPVVKNETVFNAPPTGTNKSLYYTPPAGQIPDSFYDRGTTANNDYRAMADAVDAAISESAKTSTNPYYTGTTTSAVNPTTSAVNPTTSGGVSFASPEGIRKAIDNFVGGISSAANSAVNPVTTPVTGEDMMNAFDLAKQYTENAAGVFGNMLDYTSPAYTMPTYENLPTLSGTDLSPYMNPYTQEVIDTGISDINRQRQQALNDLGASAGMGAFGGDRYQLAEAQTGAEFGRLATDFATQQRRAAYEDALRNAQYDISNRIARQGDVVAQRNLGETEKYQRAMDEISARTTGAREMLTLGGEMFNRGKYGLGVSGEAAAEDTAVTNQLMDEAYKQLLRELGYPEESLDFGSGIFGQMPKPSVTESGSAGLIDWVNLASSLKGL